MCQWRDIFATGFTKLLVQRIVFSLKPEDIQRQLNKVAGRYVKNFTCGKTAGIVIQDIVTFELWGVKIQHLKAYFL